MKFGKLFNNQPDENGMYPGEEEIFNSDAMYDQQNAYDPNYAPGMQQVPQYDQQAPSSVVTGMGAAPIEMKVVKPESFSSVTQIADHLLNRRTVVLNLEATNKETARRLIDFLTGVAYSIEGKIKRVANNTFIITPNNVDVSGEHLTDSASQPQPQPQPQPQQPADDFFSGNI